MVEPEGQWQAATRRCSHSLAEVMRTSFLLTALLGAGTSWSQVAIGLFGGLSEDRIWQTELAHLGALGEFRSAWFPSAAVRASLSFSPVRHEHWERYAVQHEPVEYRWLASTMDDRMRSVSAAVDLKFPFENNACLGGYYKGTYVLVGLGYTQRWQTIDLWEQDRDGIITSSRAEKSISEPVIRANFGGEWNFKWGGPFVEGLITASSPGLGPPGIRFPGAAMLLFGYRYSFAKPEADGE